MHLWQKLSFSVALSQWYSVTDDGQLPRLEDRGFLEHLLLDVLAHRDTALSVNIEAAAGKMQVLAAMQG
jgi:hypothetical protein